MGSGSIKEVSEHDLVRLMVETATASSVVQRERGAGEQQTDRQPRLEVEDLHTDILKGVSFSLRDGELLGIGGLQGQGQRDLLLALFGDLPYRGDVRIAGEPVRFHHPSQAIARGLALVPGERSREGLLFIRSILENLFAPSWKNYGFPLRMRAARVDGLKIASSLNLKMAGLEEPVSSLSGGNAQKVVHRQMADAQSPPAAPRRPHQRGGRGHQG